MPADRQRPTFPETQSNHTTTIPTVVFDTKPYNRQSLQRASAGSQIEWR
jgi:hypothetical protein